MPMSTLLNIAIAEPSAIIRSGLEAVLKRLPGFRIQIIEIATAELLQKTLRSHKPDMLIINPSLPRLQHLATPQGGNRLYGDEMHSPAVCRRRSCPAPAL